MSGMSTQAGQLADGASDSFHNLGLDVQRDAIGSEVVFVERFEICSLVSDLADQGYTVLLDVCAVDYLEHPGRSGLPGGVEPQRFEVVYLLMNQQRRKRLRIRTQIPGDNPSTQSLTSVHPGAEAPEREVYDLFGISFEDHPDLTRILLPDDWQGHPLRKDYDSGSIPVEFKHPERPRDADEPGGFGP